MCITSHRTGTESLGHWETQCTLRACCTGGGVQELTVGRQRPLSTEGTGAPVRTAGTTDSYPGVVRHYLGDTAAATVSVMIAANGCFACAGGLRHESTFTA